MKLEEIKDQVAFDYGHSDWRELEKEYEGENISFEHVYKEVAQRYAQCQTQEIIELLKAVSLSPAFEKAKEQFGVSSPNHWTNKVESVILKYQKP